MDFQQALIKASRQGPAALDEVIDLNEYIDRVAAHPSIAATAHQRIHDMIRAGVGTKTGWRMGHVAMDGPNGSLAGFADTEVGQKIYVHINNTNPALVAGSPERGRIEAAGWTLATDGLMVTL